MAPSTQYTTQLQAGLGMLDETLTLLRQVEPGDTPRALAERVLKSGVFSRTTARRARNIAIEMFAPRFLSQGDKPALWLKELVERRLNHEDFRQLCFLYTARAQAIFHDFVLEVYWPRYGAGARSLGRVEAESFVQRALDTGRMQKRWTETTIRRVSGYLLGCCADFGLLEDSVGQHRAIRSYSLRPRVAMFLAYELHHSGQSDMSVTRHPDWRLFGLEPAESLNEVKRLSHEGHLLLQASADVVQISWKYKSMEELARAIA